jgi:hypothetical protein
VGRQKSSIAIKLRTWLALSTGHRLNQHRSRNSYNRRFGSEADLGPSNWLHPFQAKAIERTASSGVSSDLLNQPPIHEVLNDNFGLFQGTVAQSHYDPIADAIQIASPINRD